MDHDRIPSRPDNTRSPSSTSTGKEKEKEKIQSPENSKSVADRLQASGRLALNAFGTGPDLTGHQPAGKASGSTGIGSIESSSKLAGEASSQRLRSAGVGESLRSQGSSTSGASAQAFNDFTSAEPTLNVANAVPHDHAIHKNTAQRGFPKGLDITAQESVDGAAVLDLLDGPNDELDGVLIGAEDPEAQDDILTPEATAKLRKALFSSHAHSSGSRWEDLLNFNPEFLSRLDAEAGFERQLHMGTSDAAEARDIWVHQWSDVLSAYTDQVWGDLEPLIAEARKEVEAAGAGTVPETQALDRLRQILAHVRGF